MSLTAPEIAARYDQLLADIEEVCRRSNRQPDEITVVAVSKVQPISAIEAAVEAGCLDFGENRIDELRKKLPLVPERVRVHFIGHLQRNKVKYLTDAVTLIHSVDNERLIETFERRFDRPLDVLIQVNVGGESQKSGANPDQALSLALRCRKSPVIRALGLMCIPPFSADPEETRPFYRQLANLRDRIREELGATDERAAADFRHLSMGMTADFAVAIEEGATLVRVGTRVFGPRPSKKELL